MSSSPRDSLARCFCIMFHAWNVTLRGGADVTESEKIGLETGADDIKNDESDRRNKGKPAG